MEGNEKLIEMIKITNEDFENENSFIVITTENGLVKRTKLSEFKNLNSKGNRGIKAITLNENDEVTSVFISNNSNDMIMISDNNKAIKFGLDKIPFTSRTSKGVIGMRMTDDNSKILKSVNITNSEMVMTLFTENGNGKKFSVNSIRKINRGGKGVNIFNEERNESKMIDIVVTEDNDEIVLISKNGIINKINSNTINEKRKQAAIANKVMDIDEDDNLMVAFVLKNEDN
jgi:DNA gyrase subunit A